MMEAAAEAVAGFAERPKLLGVTVLTSMEAADLRELGWADEPQTLVRRWAALAQDSGLDGVVCSAQEAQMLRQDAGADFLLVTPGIRLADGAGGDDQRRVMTPEQAVAAGADYLVMGRPITRAADPAAVLRQVNAAVRA